MPWRRRISWTASSAASHSTCTGPYRQPQRIGCHQWPYVMLSVLMDSTGQSVCVHAPSSWLDSARTDARESIRPSILRISASQKHRDISTLSLPKALYKINGHCHLSATLQTSLHLATSDYHFCKLHGVSWFTDRWCTTSQYFQSQQVVVTYLKWHDIDLIAIVYTCTVDVCLTLKSDKSIAYTER